MRARAAIAAAAFLLAACGSAPTRVEGLRLPATWQGTLPCGDCSGIRWTLTLRPEGEYWLERAYLGTKDGDHSYLERARWRRGDHPDLIEMFGARSGLEYLRLRPDGALQKLDNHGKEPAAAAPALLARQPAAPTRFGPVRMDALYRYSADAALVEDCMLGRKYNVVGGAAATELERAYLALAVQGEPRHALLSVEIAPKAAGEEGLAERVAVVAVGRLTDGRTCDRDPELTPESQAWTPVELDGQPYPPPATAWTFAAGRFSGALACNTATGGYHLEPMTFSFSVLATTRMACDAVTTAREQALVEALNAVRKWTVTDGVLELRDAAGGIRLKLRRAP